MAAEARWMSYAELAEARGISTASATRLAMRRKWPRRLGNDGTARVAVPVGQDQPSRDDRDDVGNDITRAVNALETAVATLREQLDGANSRAHRAEQAREALQTELTAWLEASAKAEDKAKASEAALAIEREARRKAEAALCEAAALQAEFRSRGRLAAAWAGFWHR